MVELVVVLVEAGIVVVEPAAIEVLDTDAVDVVVVSVVLVGIAVVVGAGEIEVGMILVVAEVGVVGADNVAAIEITAK